MYILVLRHYGIEIINNVFFYIGIKSVFHSLDVWQVHDAQIVSFLFPSTLTVQMNSAAIDSWALALADKEVSPPIGPSRIEDVQDLQMSGGNRTHNMKNQNPAGPKKGIPIALSWF